MRDAVAGHAWVMQAMCPMTHNGAHAGPGPAWGRGLHNGLSRDCVCSQHCNAIVLGATHCERQPQASSLLWHHGIGCILLYADIEGLSLEDRVSVANMVLNAPFCASKCQADNAKCMTIRNIPSTTVLPTVSLVWLNNDSARGEGNWQTHWMQSLLYLGMATCRAWSS